MADKPTVDTAYRKVNARGLEKLQDSYDPGQLYSAVEGIDDLRSRIDGLSETRSRRPVQHGHGRD
jgi:hypothetical protein